MTTEACTQLPQSDAATAGDPLVTPSKRERRVRSAAPPPQDLAALPERVRQIAIFRGLGYKFREIADHFGVTPQAISLMLLRYQRCLEALRGSVELDQLSPRAINALGRHGIRSRSHARRSNAIELLKDERNCGRKTLQEVERWMNQDESNGSTR